MVVSGLVRSGTADPKIVSFEALSIDQSDVPWEAQAIGENGQFELITNRAIPVTLYVLDTGSRRKLAERQVWQGGSIGDLIIR
jgi:hypothetical protein